jgi:hypothetical protein
VVSTAAPTVKPVAVGTAEEVLEVEVVVALVVTGTLEEVVITGAVVAFVLVGVGAAEV